MLYFVFDIFDILYRYFISYYITYNIICYTCKTLAKQRSQQIAAHPWLHAFLIVSQSLLCCNDETKELARNDCMAFKSVAILKIHTGPILL